MLQAPRLPANAISSLSTPDPKPAPNTNTPAQSTSNNSESPFGRNTRKPTSQSKAPTPTEADPPLSPPAQTFPNRRSARSAKRQSSPPAQIRKDSPRAAASHRTAHCSTAA